MVGETFSEIDTGHQRLIVAASFDSSSFDSSCSASSVVASQVGRASTVALKAGTASIAELLVVALIAEGVASSCYAFLLRENC